MSIDDIRNKSSRLFEIKMYKEYIDECDFPDEMQNLINRYEEETFADEPNKELLEELRETIENEYPVKCIREIYFGSGTLYGRTENILSKFLIWLKAITNNKISKNMTFIIIAIIFASTYFIVENNKITYKEKIRQDNEQEIEHQREELNTCMDVASSQYYLNWDDECKSQGLKKNCRLPEYNANTIEERKKQAEKTCMDKFKSKAFSTKGLFDDLIK